MKKYKLKKLGRNIVVVVPPLGIEKEAVEVLRSDFIAGFIEDSNFRAEHLEQKNP